MRLFTGIDLPADVLERLERLLARLRPAAHFKWSPLDNLHITTKFIGEWPEARLDLLQSALSTLSKRAPVVITIEGLGWFPNPQRPHVFWAGVHASQALADLARDTEELLVPLGVAPETRPYSPHLTLARISQPAPLHAIQQAITKLESVEFGIFRAELFSLYQSQQGAAGSVYTRLSEFRFAA